MIIQPIDEPMESELSKKVEKYVEIEKKALDNISICIPENSALFIFAKDALEMIKAYYNDAIYFRERGDLINALSALNYSYGWIDCCVRLGVFKTDSDYSKYTFFK